MYRNYFTRRALQICNDHISNECEFVILIKWFQSIKFNCVNAPLIMPTIITFIFSIMLFYFICQLKLMKNFLNSQKNTTIAKIYEPNNLSLSPFHCMHSSQPISSTFDYFNDLEIHKWMRTWTDAYKG